MMRCDLTVAVSLACYLSQFTDLESHFSPFRRSFYHHLELSVFHPEEFQKHRKVNNRFAPDTFAHDDTNRAVLNVKPPRMPGPLKMSFFDNQPHQITDLGLH
jgi:hypothetical protein